MQHISRSVTPLLLLACVALLVAAAWLVQADPTVPRQVGPDAGCSAAYDTALFDADNVPGGEPLPDAEDVAKACRQAGKDAFAGAVGLAVSAAVLAAWTVRRARRRRSGPPALARLVRVGVGVSLLVGVLLTGLAASVGLRTALEDVADLRMGDKLIGWPGYVVAVALAGTGAAGLVATRARAAPVATGRGRVGPMGLGVPVAPGRRVRARRRGSQPPGLLAACGSARSASWHVRECPVGVGRAGVPLGAVRGVRECPQRGGGGGMPGQGAGGCGPGRCRSGGR